MHLQLTISLLISNHLHSIRRCLDSLVPILMQIPSELIIIDTSENKQVHQLALQYTNHVIPFHWCNDFSKARNTGLERARGEWFMYIDDDEWLEDVDEIVDFFASGMYRKYNCASYTVRNYTEWNGTNYIDAHLIRMTRLTPETKFVNSIHEYIIPLKSPLKAFSAYAHHYGYVKNIMKDKTERNRPLLEQELKEQTPTAHIYMQLSQEYMSEFEYAKAEECAWKCLELNKHDKKALNSSWCIAFIPYLISQQKEFNRAFEVGKEMLRHPSCTEIAALRVYADLIVACGHLDNKEKNIIIYAKAYHDTLDRLDAHPEQWIMQSYGRLGEQQSKCIRHNIYVSGLKTAILLADKTSSLTFLQWFPWETKEIEKFYDGFFNLMKDEKNGDFFLDRLCELDNSDAFISFSKAKAAWRDKDLESAIVYYQSSLLSRNISILREAVLLSFQSKDKISLYPLLNCIDLNQWLYISSYVSEKAVLNQIQNWILTAKIYLKDYPIQSLSLLINFQERLLIEGILEICDEEIFEEMSNYCEWVLKYYSMIYQKYLQTPDWIDLMPQNFRFALQIKEVFDNLKIFNYQKVLQGFRQAIEIYQPLCGIVRRMLSVIENDMKHPIQNREEFEILGVQVKSMVQDLLHQRRYDEALPLVQQLSSLLPKDLEVLRLRQELWSYNGE